MIKKILVTFLLIVSTTLYAQRTNSSPYSFFGIGDEFKPLTMEQSSMGGIGVAFSHYKYLNFTNPAAISDIRFTTYAFGLLNTKLTLNNGATTQSANSTSLKYAALAFPIGSKAGFSVGMQPLSSVGYSLSNTLYDTSGNISEVTVFSGNGGVNRIYGSFGIKVYKGLSLGLEADFNFGKVENNIINQLVGNALATKYNETTVIRGGSIKLGAQYKKELKNNLTLNAGATFKLGTDLTSKGNDYLYSLSFGSNGEIPKDTLSTNVINAKYNLPLRSIVGLGLGKLDKWYAGFEYESQDAIQNSGLLNNVNSAYRYENSNRISFGGFYIPKANSISSYWDRVTYRAGIRMEKTGLLVDGSGTNTNFTSINDFGISFGLGLPLKQLSSINAGFEFGKRGTTSNNLIKENYFNFRLSLSLNAFGRQAWFQKRKID